MNGTSAASPTPLTPPKQPWILSSARCRYSGGGVVIQLAIDIDTASIDARLSALDQVLDTTPPLGDISAAALPTLRMYPPELPNQRYQRTGTLGRGWRASAAGAVITLTTR